MTKMGTNSAAFQRNQIKILKVECGAVIFNRFVVFITVYRKEETVSQYPPHPPSLMVFWFPSL